MRTPNAGAIQISDKKESLKKNSKNYQLDWNVDIIFEISVIIKNTFCWKQKTGNLFLANVFFQPACSVLQYWRMFSAPKLLVNHFPNTKMLIKQMYQKSQTAVHWAKNSNDKEKAYCNISLISVFFFQFNAMQVQRSDALSLMTTNKIDAPI